MNALCTLNGVKIAGFLYARVKSGAGFHSHFRFHATVKSAATMPVCAAGAASSVRPVVRMLLCFFFFFLFFHFFFFFFLRLDIGSQRGGNSSGPDG